VPGATDGQTHSIYLPERFSDKPGSPPFLLDFAQVAKKTAPVAPVRVA